MRKLYARRACVRIGLADPDNAPILNTTGLGVSHVNMAELAHQCPGRAQHQLIAGHVHGGECRSALCAKYTDQFVRTWMSCIRPHWELCLFAHLQDETTSSSLEQVSAPNDQIVREVCAAAQVQEQDPEKVKTLLNKSCART